MITLQHIDESLCGVKVSTEIKSVLCVMGWFIGRTKTNANGLYRNPTLLWTKLNRKNGNVSKLVRKKKNTERKNHQDEIFGRHFTVIEIKTMHEWKRFCFVFVRKGIWKNKIYDGTRKLNQPKNRFQTKAKHWVANFSTFILSHQRVYPKFPLYF